jgi:esterase/lipase
MNKLIEIIKNWFRKRKAAKLPVLYCVHGFGVRRNVEFEPLKAYFESKGHTVITIQLFDQSDETDTDPKEWIQRAKDGLEPLINDKRRVWLMGFSMGGVIASHLASLYPVERVVLLAPAFEYVTLQTVKNVATNAVRSLLNKPKPNGSVYPALPDSFAPVFRSVIASCKDSISQIDQPVLFLHGSDDEVIPVRSSQNAYRKIWHSDKLLLVIEGVLHRILDDQDHQEDILHIIDDFFNGKLILDHHGE